MVVVFYLIGILFSLGMFFIGKAMRLNPEAAERIFFWMPRFAAAYFRVAGTFFWVFGMIGIISYALLMAVRLI